MISVRRGRILVDPGVTTADGKVLSAPSVAGLMAVTPFWESPSNRILQGVVGTGRLIDRARAQALNDDYIATIIRRNGFRLVGQRDGGQRRHVPVRQYPEDGGRYRGEFG